MQDDEILEIIKKLEYRLCYPTELRLSGHEIRVLLELLYSIVEDKDNRLTLRV